MGRRKRATIEDDMDSSDESAQENYDGQEELNGDERAERELFENPYQQRKRRRLNGKHDATYGIFAEEEEEAPRYARAGPKRRAKTPTFVSKGAENAATPQDEGEEDDAMNEDGESIEEDSSSDLDDDEGDIPVYGSRRPRENIEEEEEEEPPTRGLGAFRRDFGMTDANDVPPITPENEPEPPKGAGIGFKRGTGLPSTLQSEEPAVIPATNRGIGSSTPLSHATDSSTMSTESLPTSFGASRTQRAFVRAAPTQAAPIPKAELSMEERAHFAKISGTLGAKMMAKMGWSAGTGLGASGQGIVTPVESKTRPKGNIGIAFGGFKERTKQAVAEDKRRGKVVSDDEDEKVRKRARKTRGIKDPEERAEAWRTKQTKKKKIVVEHKTYEEIVQAAGLEPSTATAAGIGPIIDATGATLREVPSLAEVSNAASWTPSTDPTRIPEIRHNVRLIVEMAASDVRGLAKEGKALQERRKYVEAEDMRLRKRITDEAALIERLQRVHLVIDELAAVTKQMRGGDSDALAELSPSIEKLVKEFSGEYERYGIDEVVVAALAPAFKVILTTWRPLEEPAKMTDILKTWRPALRMSSEPEPDMEIDIYGAQRVSTKPTPNAMMTPYEALLWHAWLPKIRSAINNEWDATDAAPAVALFEAWLDLIPPFIRDNILDQLILPKVHRAMSDWKPKRSSTSGSLHSIVFAWLPIIGLRMEELLGDAKRRVKSLFRSVEVSKGVPAELLLWKPVFDPPEWEKLHLKYIVPKLGETLREDLKVNPRKQDMDPLNWVLAWSSVISPTVMSQLLETEFFPKWLETLHKWLIAPDASLEDIAQWYERWKDFFPANMVALPGVSNGFRKGLELMLQATKLGPDVATKLPKPSLVPSTRPPSTTSATSQPSKKAPSSRLVHEITFKSIAEEFAAQHNLLWVPTGRVHERSRLPMYRVTARADGKSGGVVVYVLDDAVWLVEGGSSSGSVRAVTLEEMALLGAN